MNNNRKKMAARKARMERQRKARNRRFLLTACAMLALICVTVIGTVAWMTDKTDAVTNTFTAGDISITLDESKVNDAGKIITGEGAARVTANSYKMVPGCTYDKDPKVTVKAGSEACWLFVKVDKTNKPDDFLTYVIAVGWTALPGYDGVYYREVDAATTDKPFYVLQENQFTVDDEVTKAQLNAITAGSEPTLEFTAYAVQKEGFTTAAAAWTEASK